jgi:asparagine synthase (glutamine-hydrolysing)
MPDGSRFARTMAQQFHCNHREIEVEPDVVSLLPKMMWHLDEPLADPAAINTYLIAKSARENGIPVLLNGMGGDEVFGGYRKHLACLLAEKYQTFVPRFAQAFVKGATDLLPAATSRRGLRTVRWAKRFVSFASLPETCDISFRARFATRFQPHVRGEPAAALLS